MLLERLERVFMVIGDKVINASVGAKTLDEYDVTPDDNIVVDPKTLSKLLLPNETRNSLNNISKEDICELSLKRFGKMLDINSEKKDLISSYLSLQDTK